MAQLHINFPSNHAPTYNDKPMHPLLAAINGNIDQYANIENSARYHNHLMSPMQPLEDDDNPMQRAYPSNGGVATGWGGDPTGTGGGGGTGHSGYGYEQPSSGTGGGVYAGGGGAYAGGGGGGGYDYHPAAPLHVPTGGSYAPYATAGSGYGAPVPPPKYHPPHPHLPPAYPSKGNVKKKKYSKKDSNASAMNALTLLAFFFFVNLLQTCLKDNMEAMNPTVMVMTKNMVRNRNSKLAEMNSREHSTSPASTFTSGANIVVQPGSVLSAAAGAASGAAAPVGGSVVLQTSPYSDGGGGGGGGVAVANTVNVGNNHAAIPNVISNNNNNQQQYNNNYNNNNQALSPHEPQYSYGTVQQQYNNVPIPGSQHNLNMHNNNNNAYAVNPHFGQVPLPATPTPAPNHNSRPIFHDSAAFPYSNQTLISPTIATLGQQYYQEHQQQHQQQQNAYTPPHFDQEPQIHRPPHKAQIQQQQQQHSYEANQFQQQQQDGQHDHQSHMQQHPPHPFHPDHNDHYENEHEHPSEQDHFQHHYLIEHQTHQQPHNPFEHRPKRPNDADSLSSNPWSHRPGYASSLNANKRGSHHSPHSTYTWSSGSVPSRVSGNNNFNDKDDEDSEDDDRYGDTFYTRSNRRSYIDKL